MSLHSSPIGFPIIYVGTLSKLLFPSARLGFMSVPESFANQFIAYRRLVTHQNEALFQEALARWIKDGGLERHLNRMRRLYNERLDVTLDCLRFWKSRGKNITWITPKGGMAIWLNLNCNSSDIAKKALKSGVFVNPEQYYRLDNEEGTHLRLGFTNQDRDEIKSGLKELMQLLP